MKTIRLSVEVWRAVNRERNSPSETFDGALRRKLKLVDMAPEIPNDTTIAVSDEVYKRLGELWESGDSYDTIVGFLFNLKWDFSNSMWESPSH